MTYRRFTAGDDIKVKAVAATAITLSGLQTLDQSPQSTGGYTTLAGDAVLVAGQGGSLAAPHTGNGLYLASSGAWPRVTLVAGTRAASVRVWVDKGYYWQKQRLECVADSGSDLVGTDALAWRRVQANQEDLPYDSHDLACWITRETGAIASVSNDVPGAPVLTMTAHYNGANSAFFTTEANVGPFGGTGLLMSLEGRGLYGANAALDAPATCHVSSFFQPVAVTELFGGGNRRQVFGRTRAAVVTLYDAASVALAFGGNVSGVFAYGDGSLSDFHRRVIVDGTSGGVLSVINAAINTAGSPSVLCPNKWHQLDLIYNAAASPKLLAMVDGNRIALNEAPAIGATLQGTGNGYWFIGNAFANVAGYGALPGRHSRVRVMDADRGQDWVQERFRRMSAWVGS